MWTDLYSASELFLSLLYIDFSVKKWRKKLMFTFKEWLVCDTIRTEVYEPLMYDMAYDRAYSLVLEAMSDASSDDPRRDEKIALKDAMIMIMWKSMLERASDIEKLKDMEQKIKSMSPSSSFVSLSRPAPAKDAPGRQRAIKDAEDLLEKLGYIDREKIETNLSMSDSQRTMEGMILHALEWAAQETGNELPKGVDENKIKEMLAEEAGKSKESFFRIIATHLEGASSEDRGLFQKDYEMHTRKNQSKVYRSGSDGNTTGHTTFEAPDLANSVALRLYDKFSKRQWGNTSFGKIGNADYGIRKKRPKAWSMPSGKGASLKKIGNSDADLGDSSGSDAAYSYVRGSIRKEPAKQRQEMNRSRNPSFKSADPVTYRKTRIKVINGDLNSWEKSSNKYISLLNNLKSNPNEAQSVVVSGTRPSDDQLRHDIVLDMLMLNSHPAFAGRAGDPVMLRSNLETYRDRFLKSPETPGMVVSALAGKEDKGGWGSGDIRDRDEKLSEPEKGDFSSKADTSQVAATTGAYDGVPLVSSNPQSQAQTTEDRRAILTRLLELMRQLKQRSPEQAIALCVKFNMNQSLNTIADVAGISGAMVGTRKSEADCESQMFQIGLPVKDVAEKLGLLVPTVREQVQKGIRFLCLNWLGSASSSDARRHTDIASSRGWIPQRASFAAAKPSPLSSMIKRKPEAKG
jgi:DNA-directed RNA polymerase specialized sigma24 family protein